MNVNFLVIMIATVFSSSLLQTKGERSDTQETAADHITKIVLTKSGTTLKNLITKLFTKGQKSKTMTNRGSTTHTSNKTPSHHLTEDYVKQFQKFSGAKFLHTLASKILSSSLGYKRSKEGSGRKLSAKTRLPSHTLSNKGRTANGKSLQNTTSRAKYNSSSVSHITIKNGSTIYGKNHTSLYRGREVRYLTHLIYKLNRFYSNMSNLNGSKHGNILHIPFRKKEVGKLEKLLGSLINKEGILLAQNRSVPGNMSRSKLRSFASLLTQLNKLQNGTNGTIKQLPFKIKTGNHNTSRKDFVVWDDEKDYNSDNMADYPGNPIEDNVGNHLVDIDDRSCYNCEVGTNTYEPGAQGVSYDEERLAQYIIFQDNALVNNDLRGYANSQRYLPRHQSSEHSDYTDNANMKEGPVFRANEQINNKQRDNEYNLDNKQVDIGLDQDDSDDQLAMEENDDTQLISKAINDIFYPYPEQQRLEGYHSDISEPGNLLENFARYDKIPH